MNKKASQILNDIYPRAKKYCIKNLCEKNNIDLIDIYGQDFEDVFHESVKRLLSHLNNCDEQELEHKLNEDYFFYALINNFKQVRGKLGRERTQTISVDAKYDFELSHTIYAQTDLEYLKDAIDSLEDESKAVMQQILRDGSNKTDLIKKLSNDFVDYESIDELEAKKHRYAVRAFIRNKMMLSELSNVLIPQEYKELKKQLKVSHPKWGILKKAISKSPSFDLDFYLSWKSKEYMNKPTRNSTRRFYKKLKKIKKQFREFGYNIQTDKDEVMQKNDHSKQKLMDKLDKAIDNLAFTTDDYIEELKKLSKEVIDE